MTTRNNTRTIYVGDLPIGGGHPVVIQSMTNTDTRDVSATVAQITRLDEAGCELVRVAVPDKTAAQALDKIKSQIHIPLAADIHFDYRLALEAIAHGADKLRLNPGNIGDADKVRQVAEAARKAGVPIRVGVNAGSLEKEFIAKHHGVTPLGLAESALRHIKMLEDFNFYNIVVSVKASDVPLTLAAYEMLAAMTDYPLHIGITEAGTPWRGMIKSAAGLGALIAKALGDTIRVSLTGDPVEEIRCAKAILQDMGLRRFGVTMIACPTCGRTEIDLIGIAKQVEAYCETVTVPLKVAVMGCVVNGPGEAAEADFGIAGGRGHGVIFKKGVIIKKVPSAALADTLIGEINAYVHSLPKADRGIQ